MKATFNKKADIDEKITLKMNLAEYYAIKRVLKNIAGTGEGHIETETTASKHVYVVKVLAFEDSIKAGIEFPEIKVKLVNGVHEFNF